MAGIQRRDRDRDRRREQSWIVEGSKVCNETKNGIGYGVGQAGGDDSERFVWLVRF
jgi:hypothetical protein